MMASGVIKCCALAGCLAVAPACGGEPIDVVVYGATPAGIMSAVAARREGATVALIEPSRWAGGMVAGGLSSTDTGNTRTIGGLAGEFFDRCEKRYGKEHKFDCEPHGYLDIFGEMLREAGVKPAVARPLKGVRREGPRIVSIEIAGGAVFLGKVFVDASYEGDVMAAAKVSCIVGREPRSQYGEELAGFRTNAIRGVTADVMTKGCACVGEDGPHYVHGAPCAIAAADASGKPLWGIQSAASRAGEGDGLTQAYNFRLCVTQRPDIRVPFPRPQTYDPARYELLLRLIRAYPGIRFARLVHLAKLAAGKFDLNAQGLFSTDYVGGNTGYVEASAIERKRIRQDHVDYIQGFLWFLGNDARVPAALREETRAWGLCRDEFADNDHWPYALYVREARRMIGAYVMTQKDVQDDVAKADGVGMGSFIIDSHIVQRLTDGDGCVIDEGAFDAPAVPYEIPYRCLTPKASECANLLVPVCFSASHVAYCTMRMEPVYMAMGHAAGVAAVAAARGGKAVQAVDVGALRSKLAGQKAVLSFAVPGMVRASALEGIVLDDIKAEFTGAWTSSSYAGGGVGGSFRHDANAGKGAKSVRFKISVPSDGRYEVRVSHLPASNRAGSVPVRVEHADGAREARVDQRAEAPVGKLFTSLGVFRFEAGKPGAVVISNEGTDGFVAADAVQLIPVK